MHARSENPGYAYDDSILYSTVGVSLRLPHRSVSNALPCSLNRAAAGGQLVTSSAGIIEIMPGYDVKEF